MSRIGVLCTLALAALAPGCAVKYETAPFVELTGEGESLPKYSLLRRRGAGSDAAPPLLLLGAMSHGTDSDGTMTFNLGTPDRPYFVRARLDGDALELRFPGGGEWIPALESDHTLRVIEGARVRHPALAPGQTSWDAQTPRLDLRGLLAAPEAWQR